jgi:Glycosyltransferase sugar-binding region containing DXD motif
VLHPNWDLRTYREPIDPTDWPLTGDLFDRCQNGAQKAGLIRLEILVTVGGVYVDSDVEGVRPLDPLLHLPAFAAWEDVRVVPDAVLGCVPGHQAFRECLKLARESVERGEDAWKSGPGMTTKVLPGRDDVLLLSPGQFYPVHYTEKAALGTRNGDPWVFLEHKWGFSWGSDAQKAQHARRQRTTRRPPARVR